MISININRQIESNIYTYKCRILCVRCSTGPYLARSIILEILVSTLLLAIVITAAPVKKNHILSIYLIEVPLISIPFHFPPYYYLFVNISAHLSYY